MSRLSKLRQLENRYTGPIPKEELARLSGAEPKAAREARGYLRFYENELKTAKRTLNEWDAAGARGDTLGYTEEDFQQISKNLVTRVEDAVRRSNQWRQRLAELTSSTTLAAAE